MTNIGLKSLLQEKAFLELTVMIIIVSDPSCLPCILAYHIIARATKYIACIFNENNCNASDYVEQLSSELAIQQLINIRSPMNGELFDNTLETKIVVEEILEVPLIKSADTLQRPIVVTV